MEANDLPKKMPKQTLIDHVLALRKEAGLGETEAVRPPSLMDHVIALRQEVARLRNVSAVQGKHHTAIEEVVAQSVAHKRLGNSNE